MARKTELITSHRAIRESLAVHRGEGTLLVAGGAPRAEQLAQLARQAGVTVRRVTRTELRSRAPDAHDCALELPPLRPQTGLTLDELLGSEAKTLLLVLLDHVTDPHNYGAILRSADQFSADAVIVPGKRSAPLSAVAVQSSAGTAEHVRIITVANLAATIERLQGHGVWVYVAAMDGSPAHGCDLTGRVAIVLGSEGRGVSRLVGERADGSIRIPTRGHADSLNVSVACGVLLYEIRRQQGWLDER